MIEDFIKQIIEIDKKTDQDILDIDTAVENIKAETLSSIRNKEMKTVNETTQRCQEHYDQQIAKAEAERETIVEEAVQTCKRIEKRYEEIKTPLLIETIQALFQLEE